MTHLSVLAALLTCVMTTTVSRQGKKVALRRGWAGLANTPCIAWEEKEEEDMGGHVTIT